MTTAYPLAWPPGWPRTRLSDRQDGRNRFVRTGAGGSKSWTFAEARNALYREVERLGCPDWNTVLSSNFRLNRYGEPSNSFGRPEDQGIAIYFKRGKRPFVMACDRFIRAEDNMRSLALAIEAMRQLERHGGGVMMERAFEGFAALPAPGSTLWWEVLQVSQHATRDEIEAAFRRLARQRHPDAGGSDAIMAELNAARDQALQERG